MKSLVILVLLAGAAHAQVRDRPAVDVERFTPTPGPGDFAVVEAPDVLPAYYWGASIWTDAMSRPVVFRDATGAIVGTGVRTRWTFDAGGAIGVGTRYQVGLAVPVALQWGDRLRGTGLDDRALQRVSLGDLRLSGRARLLGAPGDAGMGAAIAATWVIPTGDEGDFAGEAGGVLEWRVLLGYRAARWQVAANLGVRIRHDEVILLGQTHGDEVTTGAAASIAIVARVHAIAEGVLAIADKVGGATGPSPGEVRGGVRADLGCGWGVTLIGGAGVTQDLGAPRWRVALGVTFDARGVTGDVIAR